MKTSKIKYLVLGFIAGLLVMMVISFHRIPACQEDAVLLGTGSFERGRWTSYVCGPAVDDYQVTKGGKLDSGFSSRWAIKEKGETR